jgi:hypothetical protein
LSALNFRRILRRFGCGLLLVIWFAILLTPCIVVPLLSQGEILLTHSDVPGHSTRIWLIQDARSRGVAFWTSRRVDIQNNPNQTVCTITDVRFVMWQGSGAPNHYCSCYTRQNDRWSSATEGSDACKLAGE